MGSTCGKARDHASVCPSAGPDINMALVLEQKRAEEAAVARKASCSKHSIPVSQANGTYVNHSFQHPAESGDSLSSSPTSVSREMSRL